MKIERFYENWLKGIKFLSLLLVGGAGVWAFILLAKADNWLGISALATMILAIAAFWTLRNSREQEKRDRKERLINEIIEWVIDIIKCNTQTDFSSVLQLKTAEDKVNFALLQLTHLSMALEAMQGRSQYTSKIASNFGQHLQNAVDDLNKHFVVFVKVLDKSQVDMMAEFKKDPSGKFLDQLDRGIERGGQLTLLALKVIEEAAKIKTKDIG